MKSVMVHQFSQVPRVGIPRSVFDRNSGYKTTFDAGYLVPFFIDEALPGDTYKVSASLMARLSTPIVPFMDNLFLETFWFAVPYRLVWDNFQKFMGERDNPAVPFDEYIPQISSGDNGFAVQSLADYFGLPVGVPNLSVSALPFRAYNLIWNEWYRAEYLQDIVPVHKSDNTGDVIADYPLLRRGKRHDYFTSCNPWPTAYGVESSIGLSGDVPVYGDGHALGLVASSGVILNSAGNPRNVGVAYAGGSSNITGGVNSSGLSVHGIVSASSTTVDVGGSNGASPSGIFSPTGTQSPYVGVATKEQADAALGGSSGLLASLSEATAITINSLRQAIAVQHLFEIEARGGSRYTEIIRSSFGVISPDARLQRPEYLGGSSQLININAVQQSSATGQDGVTGAYDGNGVWQWSKTEATTPQGNLAAVGVVYDNSGFTKSFVEHSFIIGLVNVRADLTYQQGINRMWSRKTKLDFYWPALANIGEQAVLNKEIFAQGTDADDEVFGYQERYGEYRYKPSKITGKLRSGIDGSLDVWHLSQYYDSLPALNASFIEDNPPIERVVAVQDEPQFIFDSFIQCRCVRPMPLYGVPGLNRM